MSLLSELLRVYRTDAGISGRELTRRASINQSMISKAEKDVFVPSREILLRIAEALKLPESHTNALLDARDRKESGTDS